MTKLRRSRGGYTLAGLAVAVTVLTILLAMALPLWSTWIQREKEEELIFRGLQYAEAIRVFERRFGRDPVTLQELIEVRPRCIRQLWKDPMTETGSWGLVYANAGRPRRGNPSAPQPGEELGEPVEEGGADPGSPGPGEAEPGKPGQATAAPRGPIQGVFSRSTKKSIKIFLDRQQYNQWQFTVGLVVAPAPEGATKGAPRLSSRWIGRPLPFAVASPAGQAPGLGGPAVPAPDGGGGVKPEVLPEGIDN